LKKIETFVLQRDQIEDAVWNEFVDQSPQANIYSYTWYLDVVCEAWFGLVTKNNAEEWLAIMPIPFFSKLKIKRCYMPIFCQHLAILFKPWQKKKEKELGLKKRILQLTISQLSATIKIVRYNTLGSNRYLLPFYWQGYQMNLRYSYHLKIEADKQNNFEQFSHKTRTCVRKAINHGLTCENCESIEAIVSIGENEIAVNFDKQVLFKLWKVLKTKKIINAVKAVDNNGKTYAGIIYLKFRDKYIYLFGAADKSLNHFGGMSLIIWHIIQHSENGIAYHDFQGSMIESIEKFYRGFGTSPKPYYQLYKNNLSYPLKVMHQLYTFTKSKFNFNV